MQDYSFFFICSGSQDALGFSYMGMNDCFMRMKSAGKQLSLNGGSCTTSVCFCIQNSIFLQLYDQEERCHGQRPQDRKARNYSISRSSISSSFFSLL